MDTASVIHGDDAPVHVAVNRVLAELPAIGKDSWNEQQKFHFRGVDAVLNALNPLLAKHGVTIVPHKVLERIPAQRTTRSGGVMYEVNLHVQFRLYGPQGDYIEGEAWGEGTDSGDKATGKAHTAAQKVFLIQAFNVSTQEQTEEEPDRHSPAETVGATPATVEDVQAVMDRFTTITDEEQCRIAKVDFANTFGKPTELTAAQIPHAHKWLDKRGVGTPNSRSVVEPEDHASSSSDSSGGGESLSPEGEAVSASSELPSDDNRSVFRGPEENPPPKGPALAKEALDRTRRAS